MTEFNDWDKQARGHDWQLAEDQKFPADQPVKIDAKVWQCTKCLIKVYLANKPPSIYNKPYPKAIGGMSVNWVDRPREQQLGCMELNWKMFTRASSFMTPFLVRCLNEMDDLLSHAY
jgi:hypothetical protein